MEEDEFKDDIEEDLIEVIPELPNELTYKESLINYVSNNLSSQGRNAIVLGIANHQSLYQVLKFTLKLSLLAKFL